MSEGVPPMSLDDWAQLDAELDAAQSDLPPGPEPANDSEE